MNKRTMVVSLAAAAGMIGGFTPAATASSAAALPCEANYYGSIVSVYCYNSANRVVGKVMFETAYEPERLRAEDWLQDERGVVAYIRRKSDNHLYGSVRATSITGQSEWVYVPDGTVYTIQMCLDGGTCGPEYDGKA